MAKSYTGAATIKIGGYQYQTNAKVSVNGETESVKTKDDNADADPKELMQKSWTATADLYVKDVDAVKDLISTIYNGLATSVSTGAGSGNAIMTQLDIDCTNRKLVTCSITFTGVGAFGS